MGFFFVKKKNNLGRLFFFVNKRGVQLYGKHCFKDENLEKKTINKMFLLKINLINVCKNN